MKPARKTTNGPSTSEPKPPAPAGSETKAWVRRHLLFGWGAVLVFLSLGMVLEALHGFKVAEYVNPSRSTRRLMWTLAHAHGTLLGLVNIAFALTLNASSGWEGRRPETASKCLRVATVLLPGGFFLGGLVTYGGDPGLGIFLVPLGALALFVGVGLVCIHLRKT